MLFFLPDLFPLELEFVMTSSSRHPFVTSIPPALDPVIFPSPPVEESRWPYPAISFPYSSSVSENLFQWPFSIVQCVSISWFFKRVWSLAGQRVHDFGTKRSFRPSSNHNKKNLHVRRHEVFPYCSLHSAVVRLIFKPLFAEDAAKLDGVFSNQSLT